LRLLFKTSDWGMFPDMLSWDNHSFYWLI